jgi:hypothetical protein
VGGRATAEPGGASPGGAGAGGESPGRAGQAGGPPGGPWFLFSMKTFGGPHAPGVRMTVVTQNSLKVFMIDCA